MCGCAGVGNRELGRDCVGAYLFQDLEALGVRGD